MQTARLVGGAGTGKTRELTAREKARQRQREQENDPEHTREDCYVRRDRTDFPRTGPRYRTWLKHRLAEVRRESEVNDEPY